MTTIKTRFAPSPTGYLHLGNARIALFNYLFAKQNKILGKQSEFVLRIEDTDRQRSETKFIKKIIEDLSWLGIEIDEDKIIFQSQRNDIYQHYLNQLIEKKYAYPCFCSTQRLENLKQEQIKQKKPPRYDGHCRNLSDDQIQELKEKGTTYAIRFKLDKNEIYLNDIRHKKKQNLRNFGDFVIQKNDGQFIFLLTNIVDDIEQKITHSIRGEDHLTNSSLQTAMCEALNKIAPIYLHLSLIVNQLKRPLSKRDGAFSLTDLKEKSYHPLAIVNYLARLGCSIQSMEVMSLSEISKEFNIESLAKSSSQFDVKQLNFWQKKVITTLSLENLILWLRENNQNWDSQIITNNIIKIMQENIVFSDDFNNLCLIFTQQEIDLSGIENQEIKEIIKNTAASFFEIFLNGLNENWDYQKLVDQLQNKTQLSGAKLFKPLRFAISAQNHGPKIQSLYLSIDKNLMVQRAKYLIKFKEKE